MLVAVFFSGVRNHRMHIGKSKIYISILVCFGIFLFNAFTTKSQTDTVNKPLTLFSFIVIFVLLIF